MRGKRFSSFAARSVFWLVLFLAIANLPAFAEDAVPPDEPLPKELMGTWRITGVRVDTGTQRWIHVQYDDPDYMGSLLFISPQRIVAFIEIGYACKNPRMILQHTTAGALIKSTMGGRVLPPSDPTTQDYGLPFHQNEAVTVMWVKGFGGYANYLTIDGTWMLGLPDGRLAMSWNDASIIILSRAPADMKPVASFDCANAQTAVEKTICGSMELALLDRNVSSRYTSHLESLAGWAKDGESQKEKASDAIRELKKAQKAWLAKRNTCGADPACLAKSMDDQAEFLEKFEIP